MSAVDAAATAQAAVQRMLTEQLTKQFLASAKPTDGSADPTQPYQDQFAQILADAIDPAGKAALDKARKAAS